MKFQIDHDLHIHSYISACSNDPLQNNDSILQYAKDYLKTKGLEAYTPKDVIKEAFAANIIPDGQLWIDMINDRNASSHEYNLEKVNIILERISSVYFEELVRFKAQAENFDE